MLDEILGNQTDLPITEHATDTPRRHDSWSRPWNSNDARYREAAAREAATTNNWYT